MRLVTFKDAGDAARLGLLTADQKNVVPLDQVLPWAKGLTMLQLIGIMSENHDVWNEIEAAKNSGEAISIEAVRLLSPIPKPIHDVMCVGVNYADHVKEAQAAKVYGDFPKQEASVYFSKRAFEIIGPDAPIISHPDLDPELDYEVELAVIIGKTCRDVKREDAEDVIFGYSVFNDISSRILQRSHKQWYRGKSLDTYTAMGPCIVTRDELPFPLEMDVITRVNGEVRQHSNTRNMINDVAGLIADLSAGTTLEPGDIIATGTPSGVAMGMASPQFLKSGDVVSLEIPEIGVLTNPVK